MMEQEKGLTQNLEDYVRGDTIPFHMPGHKRNMREFPWLASLGGKMDITEIFGFDNLNEPEDFFEEAQCRAAKLWGAQKSRLLVNGSTGGILAAVRGVLKPGESALVARNCHKSVYHAMEICGASLHYIFPAWIDEPGIWGEVTAESVELALEKNSQIRLLVITSPTYEGICSDIASIAQVCRKKNVVFLVDEAHGAHLCFSGFPVGAVKSGADLVVQSLHKTLPSLTQTAILHMNREDLAEEVIRNVGMFQSSSPSYLLSASMEGCIRYLWEEGEKAFGRWNHLLQQFYRECSGLEKLHVYQPEGKPERKDPSKILITLSRCSANGTWLAEELRTKYHLEMEMSGADYVLAMTGMGETKENLVRLREALYAIDGELKEETSARISSPPMILPETICSLQQVREEERESLPREEAKGRICAEYVWAYPPGIPLLLPGERISRETLNYLDFLEKKKISLHSTQGGFPQKLECLAKIY